MNSSRTNSRLPQPAEFAAFILTGNQANLRSHAYWRARAKQAWQTVEMISADNGGQAYVGVQGAKQTRRYASKQRPQHQSDFFSTQCRTFFDLLRVQRFAVGFKVFCLIIALVSAVRWTEIAACRRVQPLVKRSAIFHCVAAFARFELSAAGLQV